MSDRLVSVIIPTFNRPTALRSCLASLCDTEYPRTSLEVIVVDDGGEEPLDFLVSEFRERLDVRLIRKPNAGPAAARNAGAAVASGDLLAFTDDDCRPEAGWLPALADRFQTDPEALLGGHTANALETNPFSRVSQQLVSYLYSYYNPDPTAARFFTSNNLALSAETFREMGGFDTSFPLAAGEDREFCDRWLAAGRPLHYVPEAVVLHAHNLTFHSFWRQHFNYGRGAFYFHRSRADRRSGRLAPEPARFYTGLLRYPIDAGTGTSAYRDAILMGFTQIANALGYYYEMARSNTGQPQN